MMRRSVVLPQPDGPTSAPTSPACRPNDRPRSTSRSWPAAARKDFLAMLTSSRPRTPAGDMSFNRLHQEGFDRQHHRAEGQSIGQYLGHVEQLEGGPDLE